MNQLSSSQRAVDDDVTGDLSKPLTRALSCRLRREKNRANGLCSCGREPEKNHKSCRACIDQAIRARNDNRSRDHWLVCCQIIGPLHRFDCEEADVDQRCVGPMLPLALADE